MCTRIVTGIYEKEAIRSAMEAESTAHTAEAKPAKAVAAAAMKV